MGVHYGGFYIFVPKEFLHDADVVAGLQQMGSKAVPQGVDAAVFFDASSKHGPLHGPLN